MTRNLTLLAMSLVCALLLAALLYMRLEEIGGLARAAILAASVAMAVMMVRVPGRLGRNQP